MTRGGKGVEEEGRKKECIKYWLLGDSGLPRVATRQ